MALTVFDKTQTPAVLPLSGGTMTGDIAFSPTTGGISGTTTNDTAAAGKVGQFIQSVTGNVTMAASNIWTDATSISLTAGDWDIAINAWGYPNNVASITASWIGVGTVAGNVSPGSVGDGSSLHYRAYSGTAQIAMALPSFRMSLASTTTVYYKALFAYTGTAGLFGGRISARRIR
jgi:hypothetical protein